MSIPGKQNINIGLPNQSANSDSLFEAFNKVKTNFDILFASGIPLASFKEGTGISITEDPNTSQIQITNTGVTQLIPGTGISVTGSTGNITISTSAVSNSAIRGLFSGTGLITYSNTTGVIGTNADNYNRWQLRTDSPGTSHFVTSNSIMRISGGTNVTVENDGGNITINADVSASELIGDGGGLSNINGANVTGFVANASVANSALSVDSANVVGEVANAAFAESANTANVASSALSVDGANVVGEVANAAFATSAGSADSATTAGTVTTSAQPTITSVGTLSSLSVTGDANIGNTVTASGYFQSTANAFVAITDAGINFNFDDSATLGTINNLGLNFATTGTVSASIDNGVSLAISNNISCGINGNLTSSVSNNVIFSAGGDYTLSVTDNFELAANNIVIDSIGNISAGNISATDVSATTLGGTLTTNAQPNITSVGTLIDLNVTSNVSVGNITVVDKINYNQTYGAFGKTENVTFASANTVFAFDWFANTTPIVNDQGVVVNEANPSRVVIEQDGEYQIFLELQAKNTSNQERFIWIWLAKNGTDLPLTTKKISLLKELQQLVTKQWLISDISANDYLEVRYAVSSTTGVSLEYNPEQTTPFIMPAQNSALITVSPVGA